MRRSALPIAVAALLGVIGPATADERRGGFGPERIVGSESADTTVIKDSRDRVTGCEVLRRR
jgi:hypothetical protein